MSFIDKRLEELHQYYTPQTTPEDLDAFWQRTLAEASVRPLAAERAKAESFSPYVDVWHVAYRGYDDTPINGWYLLPAFGEAPPEGRTCVVLYHGYHGSKSLPESYAQWLLQGYAVFAIDVRGQSGETGNLLAQTFGMTKGWITQGLLDPHASYYRAITVDAVRAVQWAAEQPEVNPDAIHAVGGSQGGGLALIVGALSNIPRSIIADVPNMCHMDYGIYHSQGSLTEAAAFVVKHPDKLQQVLRTLSYFDLLNLGGRLEAPVMVTVSLKDPICMPETIFAVYNRLEAPRELHVYPFNGHHTSEGHFRKQVAFIRAHSR
ncbi:alpha/beta fold hydrolase [Paenibacillus sp. IB182496]|uniref:Alpha/beta fold hydrolase n=1 Tax=Paenibacillus sabuli TaxID=2772509 RepID=A0A927BSX8_9BACL|nr:alpha/beta fold hydrolase [Paenibacillus sabuli]MBD2844929.1 alpha/beta fold hydrolase [Paenibacillus sabuli]